MTEEHYQFLLDKLFGKGDMWRHRTLRTLFDCHSTEWTKTTIEQKLGYLEKMLDSGVPFEDWVNGYREFYLYELANKEHVVDTLDETLNILRENANEDLKTKLTY